MIVKINELDSPTIFFMTKEQCVSFEKLVTKLGYKFQWTNKNKYQESMWIHYFPKNKEFITETRTIDFRYVSEIPLKDFWDRFLQIT